MGVKGSCVYICVNFGRDSRFSSTKQKPGTAATCSDAPDSPHSRDVLLLKRFAVDLIHVCLTINRHFLISIIFQYVRYVCTLHAYTPLVTYPVRLSIRPFWRGGRGGQIRTGGLRFATPRCFFVDQRVNCRRV